MVTNSLPFWRIRGATLLLWAAAAASAVFWGVRATTPVGDAPVPVAAAAAVTVDSQALGHVLGATPIPSEAAAPAAARRYALQGLLAGRDSGLGAAVIAIDGQAPRAFAVGAHVDADLVLQSVSTQQARLGPARGGEATLTLELPLKK